MHFTKNMLLFAAAIGLGILAIATSSYPNDVKAILIAISIGAELIIAATFFQEWRERGHTGAEVIGGLIIGIVSVALLYVIALVVEMIWTITDLTPVPEGVTAITDLGIGWSILIGFGITLAMVIICMVIAVRREESTIHQAQQFHHDP